jgi:hypothetical protein
MTMEEPAMMRALQRAQTALIFAMSALTACSAEVGTEADTAAVHQAIQGGQVASAYPEAVLVGASASGFEVPCSGTLISPHVVVTSAICLYRFGPWRVTAPSVGGVSAISTGGAVFDWSPINPQRHDIGVIFLPHDSPITLAKYPALPHAPVADGTLVSLLGRSQNGILSNDTAFVSPKTAVETGAPRGFSFEYVAQGVLEAGDQGGGVELDDHTFVALNTGMVQGQSQVLLTRTDLVVDWLGEQISRAGDTVGQPEWVDMTDRPSACHERPGTPCGWSATNNGGGYTCALRHPSWAEPWTCEFNDPNWVDMSSDPRACDDQAGKPCGWSVTNNGAGYTCGLRHPSWADPWTCEFSDPNWVNMSDDPGACQNQAGKACGWSVTNNGAGYTCSLRHPDWANGWTCER